MPFWDVNDCVREVERCAALGYRALLFTGEPHRFDLPYLGDPYWDSLWAAAQAHSMPVNLHVGGGEFNWDVRRTKERGFAEAFALEGLALSIKMASRSVMSSFPASCRASRDCASCRWSPASAGCRSRWRHWTINLSKAGAADPA